MPAIPPTGMIVGAPEGASVVPGPDELIQEVPASDLCSCGDRRGLSRWMWHRKQCKRHLQEHFLGYPEEFNEWPLGWALYAQCRTQVANATAAKMVFYHYDFVDGTPQLNPRGRDKLAKVTALLPSNINPIVVERTPKEPGLDQSRRLALLGALASGSFPVPAERIVIGPPIAGGLGAVEAIGLYGNRLNQTLTGRAAGGAPAAATVGNDFDGSGLSGGAVFP